MSITSLNTSGELKIPPEILELLHLQAGDKVELTIEQDGSVRLLPKRRSVLEVQGMLAGKKHRTATIEEMDEAIAEGFRSGLL